MNINFVGSWCVWFYNFESFRTNASYEENMNAIRDDATAFGLGSLAGALVEMVLLAVAVNILNKVALCQVRR